MLQLALKRVLTAIPLFLILSCLSFSLLKALPGDPIEVLIGGAEKDMSAKDLAFLRQEFGLDKSLPEQYFAWLKQTLKGNWGRSYRDERPVSILIGERLPATVFLVGAALLLAVTTGFSWGLLMLWLYQFDDGHLLDDTLLSLAYWVYSMPGFWLGFLAIGALGNLPGLPLKLLGPDNGQINLASLILPAFVLSTRRAAKLALLTRASMIAELKQGYILTARSKGLSFMSVIMKHIVINSLPPLINFLALSIPSLLGGSVLVETVFAWPGLGRLAVDSTFALNYPVLLALIMTYGALVIFSNLFADLIHLAIDPRLRDRIQVV